MWPIGFSIKWWVTVGYDNGLKCNSPNKEEKKEMKKDNPYKLNKAMASPLA